MELEAARVGTRVRVQLDYGEPHLQGSVGTVQKRYGVPDYTAFDVLLPDGRTKLFWEHQLEEVTEPAPRPKRWWALVARQRLTIMSADTLISKRFALAL